MPKNTKDVVGEAIASILCCFLRAITAFGAFRDKCQFWGWLATSVLGLVAGTAVVWLASGHPLDSSWLANNEHSLWSLKLIFPLSAGFLLNWVILRGVTLVAAVAGQAPHLREIGLVETIAPISSKNPSYSNTVKSYREKHENDQKIRIICMAGRSVFRKKHSPLYEDMIHGNLAVIFPRPHVEGASFKARAESAPKDEKSEYTTKGMTESSQASVEAALENKCDVYFHEQICIWRVVLFSEHCVVQSYLPNRGEEGHMREPILVFSKSAENSLYSTFDSMFEALRKTSSQDISSNPGF